MRDFVVFYKGDSIIIAPSAAGGYDMDCPKCKKSRWLYPDPVEGHAVWESENGGGVSVRPSIICDCGLHILIENGQVSDV